MFLGQAEVMSQLLTSPLPVASSWEMLLVYFKRRRYVRVINDSMVPTLNPGDVALLDEGAYGRRHPLPGDIVVAEHPQAGQPRLIKRVQSVVDEGDHHGYFLVSDNASLPESRDSRHYGSFSADAIVGRVTSKFRR